MAITMNSWLWEKADYLVNTAVVLRDVAASLKPKIEQAVDPLGPEPTWETLWRKASGVYNVGVLFTAYASGEFSDDLLATAHNAFDGGPAPMKALIEKLVARHQKHPGWELPNPNFHGTVLSF